MKISDLSQINVKNNQFYCGNKKIEKWWGKTLYHYDSSTKTLHTRTFNLFGLFFHCFGYKSKYQDNLQGWLKSKGIVITNESAPDKSATLKGKKATGQSGPGGNPPSRGQDNPPKKALSDDKSPGRGQDDPLKKALSDGKPPSKIQDDPPKKKADGIPDTEVRYTSTGETLYLNPTLLFQGTKCGDKHLNFALIKREGKQQLLPVMGTRGKFKHYSGTPFEALLLLAQDTKPAVNFAVHTGSPVGVFLQHCPDLTESFFAFILENDRICSLNSDSTLEVLSLIKENNIILKEATPLLKLWLGKNLHIVKLILELDPSVIEEVDRKEKVSFAALQKSAEEVRLLIDALEKTGKALTEEELWIQRAFKKEAVFSDDDFTQLDQELKIKIFFAANAFANVELVKRLKGLGMDHEPVFLLNSGNFRAPNMDIVATTDAMENFLRTLRTDKLLYTKRELSCFNKYNPVFEMSDQIKIIQGLQFFEKVIADNRLTKIKVTKKIAVAVGDSLSFQLDPNLIPLYGVLQIYRLNQAARVERKLLLEEAIELMIFMEKTGYTDIDAHGVLVAEEGIYIEQTDYFHMKQPNFDKIEALKDLVEPADKEKFLEEYNKHKGAYVASPIQIPEYYNNEFNIYP